ncbi:MAG TPA: hypothetical protein VKV21_14055 [Solirubrobacteraceae bacterium]|nr:hypothetical protein [Solirubrobacteraceae bacterium]
MTTAAVIDRPVQLVLRLVSRGHRRTERRPFWDDADLVDLGGPTLRARGRIARVRIDVERTDSGTWTAHHDLIVAGTGTSGSTAPQPTRGDALVSAAHALARHCRMTLLAPASTHSPRAETRAAREVLRWLDALDLL